MEYVLVPQINCFQDNLIKLSIYVLAYSHIFVRQMCTKVLKLRHALHIPSFSLFLIRAQVPMVQSSKHEIHCQSVIEMNSQNCNCAENIKKWKIK